MEYIQEPPFAIQIGFTRGCNLSCSFCGENGIREHAGGPYEFMARETCEILAKSISEAGWSSRIEMALHGEPTLNPNHIEFVSILRRYLPKNQLMLTSNGSGLLKGNDPVKRITELMEAGLNVLCLDDYKTVNIVPRIRERCKEIPYPVYDYPKDGLDKAPHRRWKINDHVVIIIQDISEAEVGTHADLNNHCGGGSPYDTSRIHERCAKPFREISIEVTGTVAICCNDWNSEYKIGSIIETPISELWQHPRFQAARRKLLHYQRDFGSCFGCNAKSYRVGLLPDKKGKHSLPFPDDACNRVIEEAMSGGPLVPFVARGWSRDRSLIQIKTPNRLV